MPLSIGGPQPAPRRNWRKNKNTKPVLKPGTLYLIPCPISDATAPWEVLPAGNRAVMASLDYFIVEQTRTARRFLARAVPELRIDALEFRELNEHTAAGAAVEALLDPLLAGRSAGVISEAGVPGVADPGALVVEAAHRRGIRVVPLVLNGQSFAFNGYLPVKGPERQRAIRHYERRARTERQTQLFIEAPYRNAKLFGELLQSLQPDTRLLVAAELTTPDERIAMRTVAEWRCAEVPDLQRHPAIFGIG